MPDKSKFSAKAAPSKRADREAGTRSPSREVKRWFQPENLIWLILPLLSIIISVMLFPNILKKSKIYRLEDVAERDIKASRDFLIEDKALTDKNREEAVKKVLFVYDYDSSASDIIARIKETFRSGREYSASLFGPEYPEQTDAFPGGKVPQVTFEWENSFKNRFFETFEISPDEGAFALLVKSGFPVEVEEAIIRMDTHVFKKGVVGNRMMLISRIEKGGIILHDISTRDERKITDVNRLFDPEGANSFIEGQDELLRRSMISPELAEVSKKLAASLINPNLTFNKRETELRKNLARESVKPFYFKIKKGEMLVREGERIGPEHLLRLSGESRPQGQAEILSNVLAMTVLIVSIFMVIYLVGLKRLRTLKGDRSHIIFNAVVLLVTFMCILAFNFVAEEIVRGSHLITHKALLFAMPVACGAILISIFQGLGMAITFSIIISILAALIIEGRVEFFIFFFLNSLIAAYGVMDCRERGVLIKTGLRIGLANIILSLAIGIIYENFNPIETIIACSSGFIGGILTGVISTGIIPLIEMSFGFTTDIKLLELANLDQPLLRDLMVQAPGTYHHSVIVSNMVEATAKAIQAKPLLAKVSAYYHDIGKMKKPLYFIENQMGGENRHEKLAPSMSSLVLISHVKDGVELGKRHKLGKEIIDIIEQHQGTSLISFFYQKAKDQAENKGGKSPKITEGDFRYPGPKPQTKEAGLVMLADMVEAASRSLANPTTSRIQGTVQNIINRVFSDGQLDECELTLKDLHVIAKSFNKTLSGIFHHRVEYPEMTSKAGKKGGNGSTDHFSAKNSGAQRKEDNGFDEKGLKRLGLS